MEDIRMKVTFANGQVYWFESVDSLFNFVGSCDVAAVSWEIWKGESRHV